MDQEHKQRLVAMANANRAKITSDFATVKRICDAAELVWGVWQDPNADDGVDMMVVKGEPILEFITKTGVAEELVEDPIPCLSGEQAEALRQVLSR